LLLGIVEKGKDDIFLQPESNAQNGDLEGSHFRLNSNTKSEVTLNGSIKKGSVKELDFIDKIRKKKDPLNYFVPIKNKYISLIHSSTILFF
jgi:hypothetical protein